MAQWYTPSPTLLPHTLRSGFAGLFVVARTRLNPFSKMNFGR
jgi:hypothetical protein